MKFSILTPVLVSLLVTTTPTFASCGDLFTTEHNAITNELQDTYPMWITYDIQYKVIEGDTSYSDLTVDLPYGHTAFIKALPIVHNPMFTAFMVRCDD